MAKSNIILIGMPGSGKTTIGKILASELKLNLVDTDKFICSQQNKSIPEIFEESGEDIFREMETDACREAAKLKNAIISTGGGVIMKPENMKALMKQGYVIFIHRPIEQILSNNIARNRPILQDDQENRLKKLYDERINLYRKYANLQVDNSGTLKQTIDEIKRNLSMTKEY